MKDQDIDPKDSGANNPYRILLHKLTGSSIQKPRLKTAVNVWRKTQREAIDGEVKEIAKRGAIARSSLAATRDKVARDMFERLPAEERAGWVEQAKEEHDAAMARWKEENEGKCSTTPEDRQRCDCSLFPCFNWNLPLPRCIQGLVHFAQPILDLIGEATGWACSLIAGGPEPAHGGRLNMIRLVIH